jgi:hypothetical protein
MVQLLWKNLLTTPYNVQIHLPWGSAILLLDIYTRGTKSSLPKDLCKNIFCCFAFFCCWCFLGFFGFCFGGTGFWTQGLLKNLNIDLPYNLAILLLGIYPKECDSGYYKGTCTPMFIASLFTIAKLWKQPRCLTTDEWIEKMWYLYTMEFHSATKKNEILSFISKWMELETIILSEVSQAQKSKPCMFSLICGL